MVSSDEEDGVPPALDDLVHMLSLASAKDPVACAAALDAAGGDPDAALLVLIGDAPAGAAAGDGGGAARLDGWQLAGSRRKGPSAGRQAHGALDSPQRGQHGVLFLMRGVSGSGKSTKVKTIPNVDDALVFSTDAIIEERVGANMYARFFETMQMTGDYGPLRDCHRDCQERVANAMMCRQTPIVVDNTNLEAWEAQPYVQAAMQHGYRVSIIDTGLGENAHGATPHEIATVLASRNRHGVPYEGIVAQIQKYQAAGRMSVDKILRANP